MSSRLYVTRGNAAPIIRKCNDRDAAPLIIYPAALVTRVSSMAKKRKAQPRPPAGAAREGGDGGPKKPNPFELLHSKRRFDVLGQRRGKGGVTAPQKATKARSAAVEKVGVTRVHAMRRRAGGTPHHPRAICFAKQPRSAHALLLQWRTMALTQGMCCAPWCCAPLPPALPPASYKRPDPDDMQRKNSLLIEYKALKKSNAFIDRRFGGRQRSYP